MARLSWIALPLLLVSAGCNCIATKQDWHYKFANWRRAVSAFDCCYSAEAQKCLSSDFESGFKAGFVDTSIGKDCRVPPVPPPKYWAAKYQCPSGQCAIQDWFRGYQNGIVAAQSKGYPEFNEVPVSSSAPILNKTACGMCQSCDPCGCQSAPPTYSSAGVPLAKKAVSKPSHPVQQVSSRSLQNAAPKSTQDVKANSRPAAPKNLGDGVGLVGGLGSNAMHLIGPADPELFNFVGETEVRSGEF
ncbi:MAG: hypothetical protein AAGG44_19230 [Planctomycetota bacterium]